MNNQISRPSDLSTEELQAFLELVRAGGEVDARNLTRRVNRAEFLLRQFVGDRLVGVAGLKNPETTYRCRVSGSAQYDIPISHFPFEIGWVFVCPSSRREKLGSKLVADAVKSACGRGIFATTRVDNEKMVKILKAAGFCRVGNCYPGHKAPILLLVKEAEAPVQSRSG